MWNIFFKFFFFKDVRNKDSSFCYIYKEKIIICIAGESCLLRIRWCFFGVTKGTAFWYVNSNGLVEIAVNQGRAAGMLGIDVGAGVWLGKPSGS